MFIEAISESSFSFSFLLFVTAFALSHVNKVFRVAGNVVSNRPCFNCGMECVRCKPVGYVARDTCLHVEQWLPAALKRASGGMLSCEGLCNLARTGKLLRLLPRRKATVGADLNMLWQRWDEVKMLRCLRMMDEMERRAGSYVYVSINGTHSDLSIVVVVTFLCRDTSLRMMFFARVISCRRKCRL